MADGVRYLLDANVFIEAKRRYYSFELCPGFWECLISHHQEEDAVLCNDRVKEELLRGKDDLAQWARKGAPSSFFASTDDLAVIAAYGDLISWVEAQDQFLVDAKAEFAAVADGWVVAHAKAHDLTVVTQEVFDQNIRKRVPIPNACKALNVPCVDTFSMLIDLGVQFSWKPKV